MLGLGCLGFHQPKSWKEGIMKCANKFQDTSWNKQLKMMNVGLMILAAFLLGAPAADSNNLIADSDDIRLPPKNMLISNVTFVVYDTETTGFSPKNDRLVELGAVKFRNGKVIDEKTWLINPKRSIPYFVQKVHGITPEMVTKSPTFKEVYPEFEEFIQGCVLIAHNANFDVSFMRAEMTRNGFTPPKNLTIDSLKLFRKWYPDLKSYKLGDLAKYAQVTGGTFHRAEADSLYVFLIFDKELQKRDAKPKLSDIYSEADGVLRF
jgi:DNA polymerase III epsilon subunit family exonuclease